MTEARGPLAADSAGATARPLQTGTTTGETAAMGYRLRMTLVFAALPVAARHRSRCESWPQATMS